VRAQILNDGSEVPLRKETDRARVDAMTDEDIARAVAALFAEEQFAGMQVVWPVDIAATRCQLGLGQTEFASVKPPPPARRGAASRAP
jgi:hypothetical protein